MPATPALQSVPLRQPLALCQPWSSAVPALQSVPLCQPPRPFSQSHSASQISLCQPLAPCEHGRQPPRPFSQSTLPDTPALQSHSVSHPCPSVPLCQPTVSPTLPPTPVLQSHSASTQSVPLCQPPRPFSQFHSASQIHLVPDTSWSTSSSGGSSTSSTSSSSSSG